MSLALCLQVVSQAPQHFRSFKMPATCNGCFACQSIKMGGALYNSSLSTQFAVSGRSVSSVGSLSVNGSPGDITALRQSPLPRLRHQEGVLFCLALHCVWVGVCTCALGALWCVVCLQLTSYVHVVCSCAYACVLWCIVLLCLCCMWVHVCECASCECFHMCVCMSVSVHHVNVFTCVCTCL